MEVPMQEVRHVPSGPLQPSDSAPSAATGNPANGHPLLPLASDPSQAHAAPTTTLDQLAVPGTPTTAPTAASVVPASPGLESTIAASAQQGQTPGDSPEDTTDEDDRSHRQKKAPYTRKTLASYIAQNPTHSVGKAERQVFPQPSAFVRLLRRFHVKHSVINGMTDKERNVWESQGAALRRQAGWRLPGEDCPGVEVSELFWNMYLSVMPTVVRDPMAGMCAPDLLGSTTTMPLSIISLIPDIMKHYRDVIVRAKEEIFLATNYWQPSDSVNTITQALRDLSARTIKAKRPKVVVKLMYDRGSWEQLWNAHAPVKPAGWKELDLPEPHEIPGIDLQVVNFHRVLLGTFHCKFMIVDRKVALLNSNNIQDRPNLELMTHLEGPIVDSFYEVALHSWHNRLDPPLPRINAPYEAPRDPATGEVLYMFSHNNPYFADIEIVKAARAARLLLRRQAEDEERAREDESAHPARDRLYEAVQQIIANQRQNLAHTQEELAQRSAHAMKEIRGFGERFGFGSRPGSRRTSVTDLTKFAQYRDDETAENTAANVRNTRARATSSAPTSPSLKGIPLRAKSSFPPAHTPFSHASDTDDDQFTTPETHDSDLAVPRKVPPLSLDGTGSVIDSPTVTVRDIPGAPPDSAPNGPGPLEGPLQMKAPSGPLPASRQAPEEAEVEATERDHVGELRQSGPRRPPPLQLSTGAETPSNVSFQDDVPSGAATPTYRPKPSIDEPVPPGTGSRRMFKLSKRFNAGASEATWATVEDSDELDNFRPHVLHAPHTPFPIAMACRRPHGMPGHHDIRNPQNAAWLAGFRYAKHRVFIQTPTFNARPLVRAVKQACRRGVTVTLFLDLGFNDIGESIPWQGGTNEQVVDRLYKLLGKEGKSEHLKVFWYTSKDQIRPLNAIKKQRNCHIKFAAFDDQVILLGNANGDTQSVFHSSEVNVMFDSKQVTREMMDALYSNQNTPQYGGVEDDGVWRDDQGYTLDYYGVTGGGGFFGGMRAIWRFTKQAIL